MEYNIPLGYCLTRQVKDPAYGNSSAGCIDFYVPTFDEEFLKALAAKNPHLYAEDIESIGRLRKIYLEHGEDINIPSGVHAKLEPHTALTAFNKSGVATKFKLVRGAEYVDEDYQGEIHLHVINAGKSMVTISEGQKLVQFSYVPVLRAQMTKFESKSEMYPQVSERGEGAFGSTGA